MDNIITLPNKNLQLKSLAEQRFKSPRVIQLDQDSLIDSLTDLINNTYVKCRFNIETEELLVLAAELEREIKTEYKWITIHELEHCFNQGYKNRYGEYLGLSVKTFCNWMDYYDKNERHDELNKRKPEAKQELPEYTESQKREIILNGLRAAHQEYQDTESIAPGRIYLYDFLDEHGIMPTDFKVKERVKALAEKRLIERQKAALTQVERALYDITVNGNPSKKVVIACKEISLERLFKEYKDVDQIINKIK